MAYIDVFQSKPSSFFYNINEDSNLALSKIFSAVGRFYDGDDPGESDIGENELFSEVGKWYNKLN
jgi:hypothetical protein